MGGGSLGFLFEFVVFLFVLPVSVGFVALWI